MKKRLISLVLTGVLVISSCIPVGAEEIEAAGEVVSVEDCDYIASEADAEADTDDEADVDVESEDVASESDIEIADADVAEEEISGDAEVIDEISDAQETLIEEIVDEDIVEEVDIEDSDVSLEENIEDGKPTSGQGGANVFWSVTGNETTGYTLSLTGKGPMQDYSGTDNYNSAEWVKYYRKNITKVTIANGITTIGNSAFLECEKLSSVVIPASVTSIGNETFKNCSNLTSVSMGNNVTYIGPYAFQNCAKLSKINLSTSLNKIRGWAFSGCSSLANVTLPASLARLENDAFNGCPVQNITIPQNLAYLGDQAFANCAKLSSICIPENTYTNAGGLFTNCTSLKSVEIKQGNINGGWRSGLGKNMFKNCVNLETVTLPMYTNNGKEYVYESCFEGCGKLKKIILPKNVVQIYKNAFKDCVSLEYLKFSRDLTSIDSYAFSNTPKVVVHCYQGSYGEQFCKNNYISYVYVKIYSIALNPNGGKPKQIVVVTDLEEDDVYQLTADFYTRKGYHLVSWNTKKNGTGKSIAQGAYFANLATEHNQRITLYAQWKKNTYSIKFNANGGKGSMSKMNVTYGSSKKLSKNKFKKRVILLRAGLPVRRTPRRGK